MNPNTKQVNRWRLAIGSGALAIVAATTYLISLGCAGAAVETRREALKIEIKSLVVSGAASSLTRITQSDQQEVAPALSPDGRALIFGVAQIENGIEKSEVLNSVDPSTGARRTIFTPESVISGHPAWMPDGQSLVYRSNRSGPFAIVRSLSASPNSGVAIVMDARQAPDIGWPSIAPDGKSLAAHAVIAGTSSVITLSIGKSQYAVLGEGAQPAYSPDGKRIVFTRAVGQTYQIFSMKGEDGTDIVQLTQGDFSCAQPTFSPDGKWILFVSNRSSNSQQPKYDNTWNLFAVRLDGSNLAQVTDGNADNSKPNWGRDGFIYFSSNQAGNYDIWRLHPEGEIAAKGEP